LFAHRVGDIEIRQPPLAGPFAPQESVAILGPRSGYRPQWPNPNAIAFQLEIELAAWLETKPPANGSGYDDLALVGYGHG
jgi:hypothetical protein